MLFSKGGLPDCLYVLVDGQIKLAEIGSAIQRGQIFGEIAIFAPYRRRIFTAQYVDDATVLTVDEVTLKQLYYKNPDFGFQLIGLVAAPLLHDVQRMEGQFGSADRTTPPPH